MFNILGPLTNPAHPDTYVIGAYNEEMADVMIHVYQEMGVKQAVVVHGDCGMDEVSMTGDTLVPVSYTHLDVYKRQPYDTLYILIFLMLHSRYQHQLND